MSKAKRAAAALAMAVVTGVTVCAVGVAPTAGPAMADDRLCC